MTNSSLHNLLTRLYVKSSHGLPLHLSETETALYGGRDQRLRRLLAQLGNGATLTEVLEKAGGLPEEFIHIIRVGEESGRLAEALKATMEGLPLARRLRIQAVTLQLYLTVTLGATLLFVLLYAVSFSRLYATLFGSDTQFAGKSLPFIYLGHPAVTVCGLLVLLLVALLQRRIHKLLFRLIPPLRRNRNRLRSLELSTRYLMLRGSGYPPDRCLDGLARVSSSGSMLSQAVAAVRNGMPVADALQPVIAQSGLDAFCSIAVAESLPDPTAALQEQNKLISTYLKERLAGELTVMFRWATIICGVVVGLALYLVLSSIINSYSLLEYLP